MKITIDIIKGKDLTEDLIQKLNKIWNKAFSSKPMKEYEKDNFFLVYDDKKLVSVGRLIPKKITYLGKKYNFLGIGYIVAIVKGKGYGKILVNSMLNYLKKKNKTGAGFCDRKNSQFYIKSGLNVGAGLAKRFYFPTPTKNDKENLEEFYEDNHNVIYWEGKEKPIANILKTKQKILIDKPW